MSASSTFLAKLIQSRAARQDLAWDSTVDEQAFQTLVQKAGLEGLVYSSPLQLLPGSEMDQWLDRLRPGYQQASVLAHRVAASGCGLLQDLQDRGLSCFGLRGPFDALELYEDPAARSYSDLDIYVPRNQAYRALEVFRERGFELFHQGMPWGFFFRNHLNWTLIHREQGLMCDLHWAVDHPFQDQRVEYNAVFNQVRPCLQQGFSWPSPSLEHWLLLSACHLEKHSPNAWQGLQQGDAIETILGGPHARSWIDIALFISQYDMELDWHALLDTAEKWKVSPALAGALEGAYILAARPLPTSLQIARARWQSTLHPSVLRRGLKSTPWAALVRGLGHSADFNPPRLHDAARYVSSAAEQGFAARCRAIVRLALAGIDTVGCAALARLRTRVFGQSTAFYVRPVSVKELR